MTYDAANWYEDSGLTLTREEPDNSALASEQLYVFRWNRPALPGRKGTLCRVLIRSRRMNSCMIEFLDGHRSIVSRNALAKYVPDRNSALRKQNAESRERNARVAKKSKEIAEFIAEKLNS